VRLATQSPAGRELVPDTQPRAKPAVSVVVPVYRSERSLPILCERLGSVLKTVADEFEVILVCDGSPDESWTRILELTSRYSWVRGINLMRNYGQHNALLCGIREARFDITVTLDDDLQHPPEEIPVLLAALDNVDVVYGTPQKERHELWRVLASSITKLTLEGSMGATTAQQVGAFRAFRTQLRDGFASYNGPFVSIDVLLTWATTSFTAVPVRHDPRAFGPSTYSFRKLTIHALNMMTGFSTRPLQLASLLGFAFTLGGIAVLAFVVGRYLISGSSVPGFPFLAAIISIFSGAQLFALGIIGEYLARIHFRMMNKPPFAVRDRRP
jgi:glycosyltransferase involved in cell wall biosynthesis